MTREIELQRYNITPKQFFTYCRRQAEKKGICLEAYTEYEYWADRSHNVEYHEYRHEWGKEANTTKPYEMVMYMKDNDQGYMYHMILEWQDGSGYCYIKEDN